VKYAKVCKNGHPFHVFGTHTNANRDPDSTAARARQLQVIRQFVNDMRLRADEPVIIGGDMNVPKFNPSLTSEYLSMIQTLGVGDPSGLGTPLLPTGDLPVQVHCTYCYGINQLASDPADGQTILDYLLHSLNHKLPRSVVPQVQRPLSPTPWKEFFWESSYRDLSDHFALLTKFLFDVPVGKRC
jgi:phospholipase C